MKEKILNFIKIGLFIGMLILTYFVADKFINYIMTIDTDILKRVVNMILIVITVGIYSKSNVKDIKH